MGAAASKAAFFLFSSFFDFSFFFRPPRQGLGIRLRQSRLLHEELQSASHGIAGRSVGVVFFFQLAE